MCDYKVNILMSTYNGETYVAEQIESIMSQEKIDVHLIIRDDGSTDNTIAEVKKLKAKYKEKITLICGENIGYRKSFLQLLESAGEADYYGFADQDDVWMKNKCVKAIKKLNRENKPISLYVSGVIVTDEQLEVIKKKAATDVKLTLPSAFVRNRLPGCTFLFTRELKDIAKRFCEMNYSQSEMPSHDFVVFACALACGTVIVDEDSYIYHRRLENSVTSGGNGTKKRLVTEWKNIFCRKNIRIHLASEMLNRCGAEMTEEAHMFLNRVICYKQTFSNRVGMALCKDLTCGIKIVDLLIRINIIIGNY